MIGGLDKPRQTCAKCVCTRNDACVSTGLMALNWSLIAMAKANKSSNVRVLERGRKVPDTGASMGAHVDPRMPTDRTLTARALASWAARRAYEASGGTDKWIVGNADGKTEGNKDVRPSNLDYDVKAKTCTVQYTVSCSKARQLLAQGGTVRVHQRTTVLDFNGVHGDVMWLMKIGTSNGCVVQLQSDVRRCIDEMQQEFHIDRSGFGDFARVDIAELMADRKRASGIGVAVDPMTAVERDIAKQQAMYGITFTEKQLATMRNAAKEKAAALASYKQQASPSVEPTNKREAAKRKAS